MVLRGFSPWSLGVVALGLWSPIVGACGGSKLSPHDVQETKKEIGEGKGPLAPSTQYPSSGLTSSYQPSPREDSTIAQ